MFVSEFSVKRISFLPDMSSPQVQVRESAAGVIQWTEPRDRVFLGLSTPFRGQDDSKSLRHRGTFRRSRENEILAPASQHRRLPFCDNATSQT